MKTNTNTMKIKILTTFILAALTYSCACSDEGYETYELSEFETNVIPFVTETIVNFTNDEGITSNGVYAAKTIGETDLNSGDDDSCFSRFVQYQRTSLILEEVAVTFTIEVAKYKTNTEFTVRSYDDRSFGPDGCELIETLTTPTETFTYNGFSYSNVYVMTLCGSDSIIDTIVYSPVDGIKFIKYVSGTYWRLVE